MELILWKSGVVVVVVKKRDFGSLLKIETWFSQKMISSKDKAIIQLGHVL
jgi:hypothetical protein